MIAKNCTMEDLQKALALVNQRYAGNIKFKTLEQKGRRVSFTLTVVDSKEPGHRRGIGWRDEKPKRLAAACWHVHGHFFECLFSVNPEAGVYSSGSLARPQAGKWITILGGNWQDRIIRPGCGGQTAVMWSQACDCQADLQAVGERLIRGRVAFRTLTHSQIQKCPICSFDPDHYLADGSCKCFDKGEQARIKSERLERRAKTMAVIARQGRKQ